jgi:hypothetical protein
MRTTYLGNDRDVLALTPLQVPNQKDLLGRGVVLVSDLLQGLVVGQGRVGGSETRVKWIPLDLQNSTRAVEGQLMWASHWLTAGTVLASFNKVFKFSIPKLETPMALALEEGIFSISLQVSTKFQSL